jgi:hypothetical protein
MTTLNSLQSRILNFLKECNEPIEVETIMSDTLLPRFAVENVLNDLAQVGLLPRIHESRHSLTDVPIVGTQPIMPDAQEWIADFLEECPPVAGQHVMGRHSGQATVLLAVLLLDSEDPELISELTNFPVHFVMLMLVLVAAHQMWDSHEVLALSSAVAEYDLHATEAALVAIEVLLKNSYENTKIEKLLVCSITGRAYEASDKSDTNAVKNVGLIM